MQKRMIYMLQMPDVALAPGQPLGTIAGRGTIVPAVNCPKPQFGDRSPLSNCLDCTKCMQVHTHHIECDYTPSAKEQEDLDKRRRGQAPPPPPAQNAPPQVAQHPGIAPPVPPNVYSPEKK